MEQGRRPSGEQPLTSDTLPERVAGYFDDPATVVQLACGDTDTKQRVGESYEGLPPDDVRSDLQRLFDVVTHDNEGWGQNERDAVLAATDAILFRSSAVTFAPRPLYEMYVQAINNLPRNGDYYAGAHSLYEMGEVLAAGCRGNDDQRLTYSTRLSVRQAWSSYFYEKGDEDLKQTARGLIETLVEKTLPLPGRSNIQQSWKWARQRPKMRPDTGALHDAYLHESRNSGSFKQYLYDHTPDFQAALTAQGMDIARFWNLTDPARIREGALAIAHDEALADLSPHLDNRLSRYSLSFAKIAENPRLAEIYADQIAEACESLRAHKTIQVQDPQLLYDVMLRQTEEALQARKPRRKLAPIRKLLATLGLEGGAEMPPQQIYDFVRTDQAREVITQALHLRAGNTQQALEALSQLVPSPPKYLRFMSRSEEDLYNADATGDCTAYHLESGFNAWTMAHWLANPGFQMAYIHGADGPLAKLGLVLSHDKERLRLVIDSIEVYKDAQHDELMTIPIIHAGLGELQEWASLNGLGEVLFCTRSHSSELSMNLPVVPASKQLHQLYVFGGAAGLNEVWRSVRTVDRAEQIGFGYLQSEKDESNDEERPGADEAAESMRFLEWAIEQTHNQNVFDAARTGNPAELMLAYVREKLPGTYRLFGDNKTLYLDYHNHVEHFQEIINNQRNELILTDDSLDNIVTPSEFEGRLALLQVFGETKSHAKWLRKHIRIEDVTPLETRASYGQLRHEANKLESFSERLRNVAEHIPLDQALIRIFGRAEPNDAVPVTGVIKLDSQLPVIDVESVGAMLKEFRQEL